MTEKNQIYKCNICGNIVEILQTGEGQLVCCNQPMNLLKENTEDAVIEKHVPRMEKVDNGLKVVVGEVRHPMEEQHFIEWIEVLTENGRKERLFLSPGDHPEAVFQVTEKISQVRVYCNLHGLWQG